MHLLQQWYYPLQHAEVHLPIQKLQMIQKKHPKADVEYVQDKGTLVVGITDFEPMDYKNDKDEWIGFVPTWQKHLQKALA